MIEVLLIRITQRVRRSNREFTDLLTDGASTIVRLLIEEGDVVVVGVNGVFGGRIAEMCEKLKGTHQYEAYSHMSRYPFNDPRLNT